LYSTGVFLLKRKSFLSLAWTLLLLTALFGCGGTIMKAEYPSTWPSRVTNGAQADCLDISGSYKAGNGDSLLPFFLYGIPDTTSLDWANLVQINEQILVEPDGATVTIGSPDSDHIEVMVAMHGTPIAKQVLTRSRQSAAAAEVWFGQREQSFRCEPDGIVIVGAYVFNWDAYRLPYEEKKRRYRRPGKNDVGTSRGYFDFSKATNGSLIMRQRLYFCLGCSLDELWRRWEPVLSPTTK
jgi:hypothetical protein